MKRSKDEFKEFYISLDKGQKNNFRLLRTKVPMTHSLGFYDNKLFVSEFCLTVSSFHSPSYEVMKSSNIFENFIDEIIFLSENSAIEFGKNPDSFSKIYKKINKIRN